jgi:hypothetical protein
MSVVAWCLEFYRPSLAFAVAVVELAVRYDASEVSSQGLCPCRRRRHRHHGTLWLFLLLQCRLTRWGSPSCSLRPPVRAAFLLYVGPDDRGAARWLLKGGCGPEISMRLAAIGTPVNNVKQKITREPYELSLDKNHNLLCYF